MKRLLLLAALLATGSFFLSDISTGHGGTYRGPGDTVPPGGGGGGGGGTGPTNPGPTGGSTGGPSQPGTGGPGGAPTGSGTGGGKSGGTSTGIPGASLGDGSWETWWGFNKDAYLQLKAAVQRVEWSTGDDGRKPTLRPSDETLRSKVVPALKRVLANERANDIVSGALVALAKIGDEVNGEDGSSEFEACIRPFLADPSQEISETAAVALGILAHDGSLEILAGLARDSEAGRKQVGEREVPYRTRAFATYGLGLLGARTSREYVRQETVRTLVGLLESAKASTRDLHVAAVIALGLVPVAVEPEGAFEPTRDPSASRACQLAYLYSVLADRSRHEQVRAQVPTAIARLLNGSSEAQRLEAVRCFDEILAPFSKHDLWVKQSAVTALGMLSVLGASEIDTAARKTLEAVIKEKRGDMQMRDFAAIALAQIGGRGTGEAAETERAVIRHFLLETARRGDSHLRRWAGLAVGVMERAVVDAGGSTPYAVRESLRALFDEARTPLDVGALAIGIGISRDSEATRYLTAKLQDHSDAGTQGYLCVALGLVDARAAVPAIESVVAKSRFKPELLRQAAIGLGLLGDKDVVPKLVTMLGEAQGYSSQAAIATALGFIGDTRSIDPLVAMLENSELTAGARGFAAVALGIVGDKEMLPWNAKISVNVNYVAATSTLYGQGLGILDIL